MGARILDEHMPHARAKARTAALCCPFFPAKARPALPSATHDGPRVVGEWKEGVLGAMGSGQGVNPDPADNN